MAKVFSRICKEKNQYTWLKYQNIDFRLMMIPHMALRIHLCLNLRVALGSFSMISSGWLCTTVEMSNLRERLNWVEFVTIVCDVDCLTNTLKILHCKWRAFLKVPFPQIINLFASAYRHLQIIWWNNQGGYLSTVLPTQHTI